MSEIRLQEFDSTWAKRFEEEAGKIAALLGHEVIIIHHIGSTAIPDILARPIIDILVEVKDIDKIDAFNQSFEAIGYIAIGEHGIQGRRFFIKDDSDGNRQVNLFVFQARHSLIAQTLDFRDFLITHPKEARFYSLLKVELAKQHANDLAAYMRGKEAFIHQILLRAEEWRQSALTGPEGSVDPIENSSDDSIT